MKRNDIAVGLYILAAIMFLIIPMSPHLLDFFLALNIALSMVILFNAMFTKEVLNMSAFPTVILFTTIFRIALNVSSTRLILSTGDPGSVVRVFGEFVGGGNLVIGVIIFIILIIIQFVVINKGSDRVAEVTARFTLDAMPGKQMAIDAILIPVQLQMHKPWNADRRFRMKQLSSVPWTVQLSMLKVMLLQVLSLL